MSADTSVVLTAEEVEAGARALFEHFHGTESHERYARLYSWPPPEQHLPWWRDAARAVLAARVAAERERIAQAIEADIAARPRCWRSECRSGCYYPDACSERTPDVGLTSGERYYREHGWSGCAGSAWDRLPPATQDGWNAAAAERERADALDERIDALRDELAYAIRTRDEWEANADAAEAKRLAEVAEADMSGFGEVTA